jgi:hypothetical protein
VTAKMPFYRVNEKRGQGAPIPITYAPVPLTASARMVVDCALVGVRCGNIWQQSGWAFLQEADQFTVDLGPRRR